MDSPSPATDPIPVARRQPSSSPPTDGPPAGGDDASSHPALRAGRIRGLPLRNRAVVAPMSRASTEGDGVPTPAMAGYYGRFSDGGFSLIVTEGTYTDAADSQAYHGQPGIVGPAQVEGWRRVVGRVRSGGARIVLQLMHAGALSQHLGRTAGPSAVQPLRKPLKGYGGGDEYHLPRAMTPGDIAAACEGFAAAAGRAEAAGFDGVEIHGANGYLLDQFLTDYTNRRTDDHGGTVRDRVRLTEEVIAETRRRVSADFVVGVRLSQGKVNDFDYLWPGGSETRRSSSRRWPGRGRITSTSPPRGRAIATGASAGRASACLGSPGS